MDFASTSASAKVVPIADSQNSSSPCSHPKVENTYPGLSCDVPAHLYSFSWAVNPKWSRPYVPQPELLSYIISVAETFALRPLFTFNVKVTRCEWDDERSVWKVYYKDMNSLKLPAGTTVPIWRALTDPMRDVPGATTEADEEKAIVKLVSELPDTVAEFDFLINTTRFTGSPGLPRIPGALEGAFKGDQFHSMRWPVDGLERVKGKKVAMIGCAAAAAQLVPQVQPLAGHLDLYHRTPNHFMHRPNDLYPADLKEKLATDPLFFKLWREDLGRRFNKNWEETGFLEGEEHKWSTEDAKQNLYENIKDPKLREALWPDFPIWCRRVCFHNDFYPAIAQPNCTVVLDRIVKINETGIVTAAQNSREEKIDESAPQSQHDYDVIIYATGWAVDGNKEPLVTFTGRKGVNLQLKGANIQVLGLNEDGTPKLDLSKLGPFNYFSGMVDEFPNYFAPGSTPFPLGSVIAAMEIDLDYMIKILKYMLRRNLKTIYPKHAAIERFLDVVDERAKKTPYYRGTHHTYHKVFRPDGTYVTRIHFPGSALEFLQLHQFPVWEDFEIEKRTADQAPWVVPSEPIDTPWDNVHKAIHIVR
ncbi:FAD/NAD(P)-binding domain-containing protein [Gonapodya prolifera JEL478]|uniref:FAD/NAD(P)-binding domain-containing protein n=1 Tax=Gonapodya prolifera (strain JEL478) TaxID=1344416 RepID=A0A139AYL4_GONPJ|nr:FAD/NAD(P)-binding domain-containing protein [Gonapodya prolifera JEL478]|eukprot:KXS21816.1 FAD/NAD(P)-binding domain-containing protein [Gonapodya prolifera JEL478]